MNNKLSILKSNSPNVDFGDNGYTKSGDIKVEPTDSDYFLKDQHNENQDFHMVQFVKLSCLKVERTVEENADGDLQLKNLHDVTELKGKIDKSDIVISCDGKSVITKHSDVEKQEYAGISSIKLEKINESYGIDDSIEITNQNEGLYTFFIF